MKLICPGCGSIASADSWLNDAVCREALVIITKLPSPLPAATLGYFSLFRPGKRALSWKKAKRLAGEIADLAAQGHVQVQGKVGRKCPARLWAAAMEQMIERRDSLRLPMPNHNYLRQIAWELADRESADQEYAPKQSKPRAHASVAGLVSGIIKPVDPAPRYDADEMMARRNTISQRLHAGELSIEEAAVEHEKLNAENKRGADEKNQNQ